MPGRLYSSTARRRTAALGALALLAVLGGAATPLAGAADVPSPTSIISDPVPGWAPVHPGNGVQTAQWSTQEWRGSSTQVLAIYLAAAGTDLNAAGGFCGPGTEVTATAPVASIPGATEKTCRKNGGTANDTALTITWTADGVSALVALRASTALSKARFEAVAYNQAAALGASSSGGGGGTPYVLYGLAGVVILIVLSVLVARVRLRRVRTATPAIGFSAPDPWATAQNGHAPPVHASATRSPAEPRAGAAAAGAGPAAEAERTETAAGWRPDPLDPTRLNYWDGTRWTARKRWDGSDWLDA